jgi:Amt family ammonium transporter
VEAFPVHGACGIWGVLAAALFDWGNFMDGRVHAWNGFSPMDSAGFGDLFLANFVGILAITAWAGLWLATVFLGLKKAGLLRISALQEDSGLDADEFVNKEAYSPRGKKMTADGDDSSSVGKENAPIVELTGKSDADFC